MSTHLGWQEIALRLTLAAVAGALIGLNRGEHGRPAGLRTTMLVCLAAAVSMIQANLLLATAGRPTDSFVMLDLMRLPLGILTGMGFIGAGAILKRGEIVQGVTTAATLWFVTIIGLCFGGGQNALGVVAFLMGIVVLIGLKRLEALLPRDRRAILTMTADASGPTEEEIHRELVAKGFRVLSTTVRYDRNGGSWTLLYDVRWRPQQASVQMPPLVKDLSQRSGISRLEWNSFGLPSSGSE
jgi:putative Mg2+ transporter-C (MgtC) family protein